MDFEDYYDIEDELAWEERQRLIASRVSKFEKLGWGYSKFKKLLIENYEVLGEEEEMVDLYQSFILQDNTTSAVEWAESEFNA